MIRGRDIHADFLDFKGPKDTAALLDDKWGQMKDPTLRLDLDYPNVSRELAFAPTDAGIMGHLMKRAGSASIPIGDVRYRRSASGNLHVEIDLEGSFRPSELIALRSLLGDDDFRVLCDSRRALENRMYAEGYLHTSKWIPGQKPDGSRGNVVSKVGVWQTVKWKEKSASTGGT